MMTVFVHDVCRFQGRPKPGNEPYIELHMGTDHSEEVFVFLTAGRAQELRAVLEAAEQQLQAAQAEQQAERLFLDRQENEENETRCPPRE